MSVIKDVLGNTVRAGDIVRVKVGMTEETARVAEISGGLADADGRLQPIVVSVIIPISFRLDPKSPIAPFFKLANPESEQIAQVLVESARRTA